MNSFPAPGLPAPVGSAWGSRREREHEPVGMIPAIPPAAIAGLAVALSIVAGRFFADGRATLAGSLVLAVCFLPIVLLDLPVALAVWVAILFFQNINALSAGPNAVGALVFLGWLGTLVTRSSRPAILRENSRLLGVVVLFVLWLIASVIWAEDPGKTRIVLEDWVVAGLALVVTMTVLRSARDVTIVAVAFIVGAVVSVAYGIASGALAASVESVNSTVVDGRFTGGGGDPNVQAAGFIVAMFLCAGLWSLARPRLARLGLLGAFIVVAIGFFATESRGGLLALAFAAVVGIVVLPRQRKRLLCLAGGAGVGVAIVAAVNPGAIARMTDFSGGTSGRSDLWKVALNVFAQHPFAGIGINQFLIVEPRFTLNSGPLNRVDLIAESPHLVHNVYLQLLTETGVIGAILFLVVALTCLRASWLAARMFDAVGRVAYGDIARAVLMATIAMLAAQFFISDGNDWRLWVLFGLGPVLLSLARREQPRAAARAPTSAPQPGALRGARAT